ncbi:MAG: (Fe-S)-binding protein [Acidimicrobiia bacterium]
MSTTPFSLVLDDDITTCVGCGLCLSHCPTFRVTGEEALSPRGRIAAIAAVKSGSIELDGDVVRFLDTCVQCRACEPACPSGVPYGRMIEAAKRDLPSRRLPRWIRLGLRILPRHRLLLLGRPAIVAAQHLAPERFGLARSPRMSWRRRRPTRTANRHGAGPDVWIHTGCVMDVVQSHTHVALASIVGRLGRTHDVPGRTGGCCGALTEHAGRHAEAVRLAERTMRSMPGDAVILVDSAGCGAAMKEYPRLLGTAESTAFATRVRDAIEWLAEHVDELDLPPPSGRVVVQDPCHHRHVQKVHGATRRVLRGVTDVVEVADDGLCCGAGGAYSFLQPDLATDIRARKVQAITDAAGEPHCVVASANPGCSMFLGRAGMDVRHPIDIVAAALERN